MKKPILADLAVIVFILACGFWTSGLAAQTAALKNNTFSISSDAVKGTWDFFTAGGAELFCPRCNSEKQHPCPRAETNHITLDKKPLSGWCSWYYVYADITEKEVLLNLDFLKENLKDYGLDYVQVDRGRIVTGSAWLDDPDVDRYNTVRIHLKSTQNQKAEWSVQFK